MAQLRERELDALCSANEATLEELRCVLVADEFELIRAARSVKAEKRSKEKPPKG